MWAARGKRGPVPHVVKQRIVKDYARRYSLDRFVESGTYLGDMVWAVRQTFREVHSVELDPLLYRRASARFQRFTQIHLYQGDSAEVLGKIVGNLAGPALFWLDGHYSGGITAKGGLETPIKQELVHIFTGRKHRHVALIDDARDFTGTDGYPSLQELGTLLRGIQPNLSITSACDIIRVHPE
jgi:hypothetical protein